MPPLITRDSNNGTLGPHFLGCAHSAQMGVFTVPTVRFYMDGKLAVDESGYFSLDRMLDRMERYLKILSDGADCRDAARDE